MVDMDEDDGRKYPGGRLMGPRLPWSQGACEATSKQCQTHPRPGVAGYGMCLVLL